MLPLCCVESGEGMLVRRSGQLALEQCVEGPTIDEWGCSCLVTQVSLPAVSQGFLACKSLDYSKLSDPPGHADKEIGDTAGKETCDTGDTAPGTLRAFLTDAWGRPWFIHAADADAEKLRKGNTRRHWGGNRWRNVLDFVFQRPGRALDANVDRRRPA